VKQLLKSNPKNNKICPECGNDKFYIPQSYGIYPKSIYLFPRIIRDNSYKESSLIKVAKCCITCGFIVNGVEDLRIEVNWTETDIIDYFVENSKRQDRHKLQKQINLLIRNMPKEESNFLKQLKFTKICKIFKGLLIDEDYKKILSY